MIFGTLGSEPSAFAAGQRQANWPRAETGEPSQPLLPGPPKYPSQVASVSTPGSPAEMSPAPRPQAADEVPALLGREHGRARAGAEGSVEPGAEHGQAVASARSYEASQSFHTGS